MIDLKAFKDLKRAKLIYKELIEAKDALTVSMDKLYPYRKYSWIQESISIMHNSRTLIEININKFKRVLDGK